MSNRYGIKQRWRSAAREMCNNDRISDMATTPVHRGGGIRCVIKWNRLTGIEILLLKLIVSQMYINSLPFSINGVKILNYVRHLLFPGKT